MKRTYRVYFEFVGKTFLEIEDRESDIDMDSEDVEPEEVAEFFRNKIKEMSKEEIVEKLNFDDPEKPYIITVDEMKHNRVVLE